MSLLDFLFGREPKRRAKKKAVRRTVAKKPAKPGKLKQFVVFNKHSNTAIGPVVEAKTEHQAWKLFKTWNEWKNRDESERDELRIMSKHRWDSEQ